MNGYNFDKNKLILLVLELYPEFNIDSDVIDILYKYCIDLNKCNSNIVRKYIRKWRKENNINNAITNSANYWLSNGFNENESIQKSKIKKKINLGIKYTFNDAKIFYNFCKTYKLLNKFNFNNLEHFNNLFNFIKDKTYNQHELNNDILLFFKLYRNKRGTPSSIDYWLSMGWNYDQSIYFSSNHQKDASHWCKDYWINHKNTNDINANTNISKIQKLNSEKRKIKYTNEELKIFYPLCKEFWLHNGYSNTEALLYRQYYNPLNIYLKNNIHTRKFNNLLHQSKEEILFFEFIKNENFYHRPFHILIYDNQNTHRAVYDGYYKDDNSLILIEYDGAYWHNEERDYIRDEKTLNLRSDVTGIIRIQCKYFKQNKETIIKQIYESIKTIKNSKENRIKLY